METTIKGSGGLVADVTTLSLRLKTFATARISKETTGVTTTIRP